MERLSLPLTMHFGRRRWSATWPMTLLTLAAVLLFIDLGRWQWHRAEQKRELMQEFRAGAAAAAALGGRATEALPRYTQVRVRGRYDGAHQFLLDNISHDGRPGYEVLTPLRLDDGRTLIVNRGWLPLTASRAQLPDVRIDFDAMLTPAGRLDNLPVAGIALGHVAPAKDAPWPRLSSFPTMADLATALGVPLEARTLLLNADEPLGYLRDWQPPGFGPERHLSYAIQWWGFAALAVGLYGYMNTHKSAA
jgi:surfeit locus 1 family protein